MKELFRILMKGSRKTPPHRVLQAFKEKFINAVAVEWHMEEGNYYESIFVDHGKEIICRFDKKANWIDTRINQNIDEINYDILKNLKEYGEIMSSIRIEKPDSVLYEFVVRDPEMNRHIFFTTPTGVILDKKGFNSVFDLF